MTTTIQLTPSGGEDLPLRLPPVPWRDPHTVSEAQLSAYIGMLERAAVEHPESSDLRTCLGMAYAMNYEAYKSMDALEAAIELAPASFWARMKYAELHYRLRTLERAEQETLLALDLAGNGLELSVARVQLREIRRLMREGTQRPAWTKPLLAPTLALAALVVASALAMVWR